MGLGVSHVLGGEVMELRQTDARGTARGKVWVVSVGQVLLLFAGLIS